MANKSNIKIEQFFTKRNVSEREGNAILKVIQSELRKQPKDAWLLAQMSCVLYELKQYKKALQIIKKALILEPNDPLYLWYHAGALDMLNEKTKAITVFKRIIRMGFHKVGCVETTEGIRWAKSLINDCRYRIGLCYNDINKKTLALKWLNLHLSERRPGIPSIYSIKEVRNKLTGD